MFDYDTYHRARRDTHQQLHLLAVPRLLPVPRLLHEGRHRRRHGPRGHLRHGPCVRHLLRRSNTACSSRSASRYMQHPGVHPGHRRAGAVRRDVPQEVHPLAVHRAGHLPAAHHHQLRRPGRRAAERAEQLQLHREPSSTASPAASASCSPSCCLQACASSVAVCRLPRELRGLPDQPS